MMKKEKLIKFFKFLRNKYTLTVSFLLVWLIFFDRYDFYTQYQSFAELGKLKKEKAYYLEEIKKNDESLKNLQTDTVYLEKYAREKYLMKKPNEDVFIIIDNSKTAEEKTTAND